MFWLQSTWGFLPANSTSALVYVMDWYRIVDNPLNKPILTQLSNSYMRHKAAMSNTRHGVLILLLTGPFWKESTGNLKFSKIKKLSRDPWINIVFATQGAGDFINQTNIYMFSIYNNNWYSNLPRHLTFFILVDFDWRFQSTACQIPTAASTVRTACQFLIGDVQLIGPWEIIMWF